MGVSCPIVWGVYIPPAVSIQIEPLEVGIISENEINLLICIWSASFSLTIMFTEIWFHDNAKVRQVTHMCVSLFERSLSLSYAILYINWHKNDAERLYLKFSAHYALKFGFEFDITPPPK